ncbi:MAG: MBOAT family protein [Rhodospirillales bacterium]|nr:MBOAT family protein [Rhodospirillales bacterium]
MLFNSYEFIFLYLPVVLIGFFRLGRAKPCPGLRPSDMAAAWLFLASLGFYGWWNWSYVPLLVASILFNFTIGRLLATRPRYSGAILAFGIGCDLALLGYYKYAGFLVANANAALGGHWTLESIILPLGISFFTFTQIAFLVDAWRGEVKETRLVHYGLFVTYFPHLIAGPILHHKEMMPQFGRASVYRASALNLTAGLTLFAIGLFKKAVLADTLAPYANAAFAAVETGRDPSLLPAWLGALAYALQLYFDFSGYSDMALGLSRMMGIRLPLNFDSPYQARSIIEFWRRWHMTLSRFLRDYLYIPLGGGQCGRVRRYGNLLATMLLGGLWHGAAWTFVLWGGLHGCYLVINHTWRALAGRWPALGPLGRVLGWPLTFLAVVVAWVPFRAASLEAAGRMLAGMAGAHGLSLPGFLVARFPGAEQALTAWGIEIAWGGGKDFLLGWSLVLSALLVALFLPNSQRIMARYRPAFTALAERKRWQWRLSPAWSMAAGVVLAFGLLALPHVSHFLYFQF